ncbi:MAG: S41 family peptidase [Flavobacteriaceae bacterium]|nr:S41 family peptidase [Flavobacteriaceae bacterium]
MRKLLPYVLLLFFLISCKDEDDNIAPREYDFEIEDFIWEGLNTYYFWQKSVPDLADNRFDSQKSYANFLSQYNGDPELLFESLLSDKDRFSWIMSDYTELEKQLSRVYTTSGMMIGLGRVGDSNDLFAFVRYVLPDSDAAAKNIERGNLFLSVNNEQLTIDNYQALLSSEVESFSIQLAQISGQTFAPTGVSVDLVKAEIQENPIHIHKIIELNNTKIGYLMYNGFVADFDDQLENAFAEFQTQEVNQLIIDLRYNRGGRISSSIKLASMLTGQFSGEVFAQTQHNHKLSSYNEDYLFEATAVQLEMNRLYVISSRDTASASELLINGLSPYIDVILIGDKTTGKNVGSYSIYDWDDEGNVNPRHTWAMQPITLKIANSEGFADFENGLQPDHRLKEDVANLGTLGEIDEPLLEKTLEVMGVLPPKSEKNQLFRFGIHFEKMPSLQDAIMHTETPTKMRKIRQPKDFALE